MPEGKLSEIRRRLREAPDQELLEELAKAQENLFNFRYQAATHQLENVMLIRRERKHIARIRAALHERAQNQN